jgi:V/A-type H+/Na+-transporting ATPase subunit K
MVKIIVALIAGLIPMAPAVIYFLYRQRSTAVNAARGLVLGLKGFNILVGLMAAGLGLVWLASPTTAMAAGLGAAAASTDPYASLAAAIAAGMGCIGAGVAVSGTGAAAVGSIAEKPESFGRSLIFVGLSEGIAIYGLIIAFMVLNR